MSPHKAYSHYPYTSSMGKQTKVKEKKEMLKGEAALLREAIRQRKATERKLKHSYERILRIIESTSDAFFSVDKKWRYTYLNSRAEEIEGIKKEDVIGRRMDEIFPNIVHAPFYKRYHQIVRRGKPEEFEECIKNLWYEIRAYPTRDGLTVFYRDITDRKQFEQRKDEFIGMASHELKTPITSLKLYTELLQDDVPEKQRKLYLSHMMTEVDRLSKLVNDLLDLSKMQVGKLQFRKKVFNLTATVNNVVTMIQKSTKRHTIHLKLPHSELLINGDEDRIEQVILNLLTNAIKYSPDSDKIVVKLLRDGNKAVVSVQDFGVGIHPDAQKKIFNRFYQVASFKGHTFPGLGIGLYISKVIIDHHKGKFSVNSAPGKGTIMSVSLPLHKPKKHE